MINHQKIKKIIQKISEKIQREYQPEKIILFGSYAWGKPDMHSDIDIFIIKKTKARHIDRSIEIRRILEEENGIFPMEILVYTPKEVSHRVKLGDPFIKEVITRGKVLQGKDIQECLAKGRK